MDRTTWTKRAIVAALALLLPFSGCSCAPRMLYGKSIDGEVLDAETGKPIPNAHVVYIYEGVSVPTSFTAHNPTEVCYHASAAVTDAQGRFHIDPWEKPQRYNVEDHAPISWAYAPGYVPARDSGPGGRSRKPEIIAHAVIRLKRSQATGDARIEQLWEFAKWGCLHGGGSQKSLYPAYRAAYDEARSIASTPEQLKWRNAIRESAAWVAVAPDPARATPVEELDEFVRKNFP
jgi:hypothetical protein